MENLNSLRNDLAKWETKNKPGLIQSVFTVVLFLWGYIQSDPFSIEVPVVRYVMVTVFIAICIIIPYVFIQIMLPPRIKKLRKEISDLEYLELVRSYE